MRYTFEEEFRLDRPETVGETDRHFDLDNYKEWLEAQLIEARKQLALYSVVGRSEQLKAFEDFFIYYEGIEDRDRDFYSITELYEKWMNNDR
jgi:hypothetical protein